MSLIVFIVKYGCFFLLKTKILAVFYRKQQKRQLYINGSRTDLSFDM